MTPRLPLSRLRLLPLSLLFVALLLSCADLAGAEELLDQQQVASSTAAALQNLKDQGLKAYQKADFSAVLQAWQEGLELARQAGDKQQIGNFLGNIGNVYQNLGQYPKAMEMHEQALAMSRESGDRKREAADLGSLGNVCLRLGQYPRALEIFKQALLISREIEARQFEAAVLETMGIVYQKLGQYPKALKHFEQALLLNKEMGDRKGEGNSLGTLGNAYTKLKQYPKALEMYEQALAVLKEVGDRQGEGTALGNMGLVYQHFGQYHKALQHFEQALAMNKELRDRTGEVHALRYMGNVYRELGQYPKALDLHEQALAISRDIGDREGERNSLVGMGNVYNVLGQYPNALELLERALVISRDIGDRQGDATVLHDLGAVYLRLGQHSKALEHFEQALVIQREIGYEQNDSNALCNMGNAYLAFGQYPKAMELYGQALAIYRKIGDRLGEGYTLANMGIAHREFGQYPAAQEKYVQALLIFAELQTPDSLWRPLNGLFIIAEKQEHIGEAIFWGKQAVNTVQGMRAGLKEMDTTLQRSFVEDKSFCYKDVAALLMREGRMSEAEQVLRMLKEEEYFEFTRRDAEDDPRGTLAAYNSFEKPWAERFAQHVGRLGELSGQADPLRQNTARTEAEGRQLAALDAKIEAEAAGLRELPDAVRATFAGLDRARYEQLKAERFEDDVRKELDGLSGTPAIVSFLVLPDALRILLTTPKEQRPYVAQIGARDLNAKVGEWRQQLLDRDSDLRALGAELYDVLIRPLAADLTGLGIDHLAFSLDGALRYIPLSALFDGERFLAERFAVSVFTPAAHGKISAAMQAAWRVAGFGASRGGDGLKALPAVKEELRGIVKAEDGAAGVLPGIVRLDADFTAQSLGEALRSEYPAVHIASHFRFTEGGTERDSFLLLGDGTHLNLAELRQNQSFDMRAVDMLALSACDTALSLQDADGREIDGMAVTAQRKGAKAVLASLWPVADASTATLMRDFYRLRERKGLSKAQALRQAQLRFIRGEAQDKSGTTSSAHENWTHPYFWAPFILMGNWL